jgi:hypothetical protein
VAIASQRLAWPTTHMAARQSSVRYPAKPIAASGCP